MNSLSLTPVIFKKGILVYFRVYDVDDPDENAVIDPNGTAGGDNNLSYPGDPGMWYNMPGKEPGEESGDLSLTFTKILMVKTDSSGVARAPFQVSARPGDNYRAAASTNKSLLDSVTVDGIDLTKPANVEKSQLLTVFRRLWVEFDKMDSASNEGFGILTGTLSQVTENAVSLQGYPNWGRLNGSVLKLNSTSAPNVVNYVAKQTFEIKNQSPLVDILQIYYGADYYTDTQDNDSDGYSDELDENEYNMNNYTSLPSGTSFALNTDDAPWPGNLIPTDEDAVDALNTYYLKAYILCKSTQDWNINKTFPFERNNTPDGSNMEKNTSDVFNMGGYNNPLFWSVCILWSYDSFTKISTEQCYPHCKKTIRGDDDPESEGVPKEQCMVNYITSTLEVRGGNRAFVGGVAVYDWGKARVYLETLRDIDKTWQKTLAHEIGHLFDLKHAEYLGSFTDQFPIGFDMDDDGIMGWQINNNTSPQKCFHNFSNIYSQDGVNIQFSLNNIKLLRVNNPK